MGENRTVLSAETLLPIGLVLALLAGAVTLGMMTQKVNTLGDQVTTLQTQMAKANSKLDRLIGQLSITANVE